MDRLRWIAVIAALAAAMSVGAAGPVAAGKGGNNDSAALCNQGGWKTLVSRMGDPFKNQGDCVNDGAQGVAPDPTSMGQVACGNLVQGSFGSAGQGALWQCQYPVPPNPSQPQSLLVACEMDAGESGGSVSYDHRATFTIATCNDQGPF